jgi:hypothetical protein
MGGQACVFYGAAEFSRDLDLLVPGDPASLHRLSAALEDLDAHNIAVPPLDPDLRPRPRRSLPLPARGWREASDRRHGAFAISISPVMASA